MILIEFIEDFDHISLKQCNLIYSTYVRIKHTALLIIFNVIIIIFKSLFLVFLKTYSVIGALIHII